MLGNLIKCVALIDIPDVCIAGDTMEVQSILFDKDTLIVNNIMRLDPNSEKWYEAAPEVIAPKGSYTDHVIINKRTNKKFPSDVLGYRHLSKCFSKEY